MKPDFNGFENKVYRQHFPIIVPAKSSPAHLSSPDYTRHLSGPRVSDLRCEQQSVAWHPLIVCRRLKIDLRPHSGVLAPDA